MWEKLKVKSSHDEVMITPNVGFCRSFLLLYASVKSSS